MQLRKRCPGSVGAGVVFVVFLISSCTGQIVSPTVSPTASPTDSPTTSSPTIFPTVSPTISPTNSQPTRSPTVDPTQAPVTSLPSAGPTSVPTSRPSMNPTSSPETQGPTSEPSSLPSSLPTSLPSSLPTSLPSRVPTVVPTTTPQSSSPTIPPSVSPSALITSLGSGEGDGESFPWYFIVAGVGSVLVLGFIVFSCSKCRKGQSQMGGTISNVGGKYSYGGKKSRIPDFDPDSDTHDPFAAKDTVNPLARKGTSQHSSRASSPAASPTNGIDPPTIIDKGDGIIKIDAKLGSNEILGILTKPRENVRGIVISSIEPNSAAQRISAFGVGDVLLSINGRDVLNASHEAVQLALAVCGKSISFEMLKSRAPAQTLPSTFMPEDVTNENAAIPRRGSKQPYNIGGLDLAGSNTEGPIAKGTLRKHDGLFAEGLLQESPKLQRKKSAKSKDGGYTYVEPHKSNDQVPEEEQATTATRIIGLQRSEGDHEVETDEVQPPQVVQTDAVEEIPATTSTTAVSSEDAAEVLAARRKEQRPVPPAPANVQDVPELNEAAKSKLILAGTSAGGGSANEAGVRPRKRTRTIKKEAGKLLVRLKQLVDGASDASDLPEYSEVRSALIEEFGNEFFVSQQVYVMNWLKQIGMSKFDTDSSSDPDMKRNATISRRTRTKSISGKKMGDIFDKKKKERTATGWFKEVLSNGKKRKRYCEMKGPEIKLFEKIHRAIILRDTIVITPQSGIQHHGYDLFIVNENEKWTLQAESVEQCAEWHNDLRATFIEICENIDLDAFQSLEADESSGVKDTTEPDAAAPVPTFSIGGLESSGAGPPSSAPSAAATKTSMPESGADAGAGAGASTEEAKAMEAAKPAAAAEELTPEEKAAKRAKAREALAAKRAAAKKAREANIEEQLKEIFAFIDALDEDNC